MIFDITHIILTGIVAFFFILSLFLFIKLKRKNKSANKRIKKIAQYFAKEKKYLGKEIKRQNYLISEFKQQDSSFPNRPKKSGTIQQDPELANKQVAVAENVISESEKQKFSEKNKKLWELSLAIHKEKEKIDGIKNEIEHRHNEVTKSINYAQRIQKALLPSKEAFDECKYEHFVLWKPRDIVSGDFYWLKQLNNYTIIAVADCTGHGVPGAFMSVLGISFLNDILSKGQIYKANEILEKMRKLIKRSFHQEGGKKVKASDGMDMAICVINDKTLEMDFAGANNPLFLIRNNDLTILKATRSPIGNHPFEKPFENNELNLRKGDKIYMFSDGFIDQFGGEKGRKFLKKNFQRLLLHINKEKFPMEEEKEILSFALKEWQGKKYKQVDDILILGLRI
ncbi:MAG: SpoIIE family protein phosphatase [Bacteroidota bacterium]